MTEMGKTLSVLLSSPDLKIRRLALSRLTRIDSKLVVGVLLKHVDEPDSTIQMAIFKALVSSKDPRCCDAFISGLKNKNRHIRAISVEGLGGLRAKRAVPFLAAVLSTHRSGPHISKASDALVAIGAPSVEHLAKLLHTTPNARGRIIQVLVRMSPKDGGHTVLVKALEDKDPKLRLAAIEALTGSRASAPRAPIESLIRASSDKSAPVRREAVACLARNPSAQAVRDVLHKVIEDGDLKVKRTAVFAICAYAYSLQESAKPIVELLGNPDLDVRLCVLESLMHVKETRLNDRVLIEALLSMSGDKSRQVRTCVLRVLGRIGSAQIIEPLVGIITKTDDRTVRQEALRSLSMIEDHKISTAFVKLLDSKDLEMRSDVTSAMCRMKTRIYLLDPLKKALVDPHPSIRLLAIRQTSFIWPGDRGRLLLKTLKDPEVRVRVAAARAMRHEPSTDDLTAIALKELKHENPRNRSNAMSQLIKLRIPPQAVKPVVDILVEQFSAKRAKSAWLYPYDITTLIILCDSANDRRVIPALLAAVNARHRLELRLVALKALGEIEDEFPIRKHLAPLLKDPNYRIRITVVNTLLAAGEKVPIEAIVPILKDKSPSIVIAAIRALGESRDKQALEPLQKILAGGESKQVKEARIAVAKVDPKTGLKPYLARLKDSILAQDRDLAGVIEKSGKNDLVEALIAAVSHESKIVVRTALCELRTYGDQRAIEPIKAFIRTGEATGFVNIAKITLTAIIARQKKP